MKCRLGQAALAKPEVTFAGQQSVSEEPAAVANDTIFLKISRIAHEHGFDQIGMIEKINWEPSRSVVENIAVFPRPL